MTAIHHIEFWSNFLKKDIFGILYANIAAICVAFECILSYYNMPLIAQNLHFKHFHWWKRWTRSKFASHCAWGTNRVCVWMQDGCKVYMDSYMASNGSCFMITSMTIFKDHLLDIKWETMALQTLTTLVVLCEDPHEYKFIAITFGWGPNHRWLHTTFEDPWPHYMMLEVCCDGLWTYSFGLSQFHSHGSSLVCAVALNNSSRWISHDYSISFHPSLPGYAIHRPNIWA